MPKPMYVWSGSAWVSVATEVESLATYATQSYASAQPGMKMVVPTSVAVGSGSGSVDTNGAVTFSGASSISLNGCFTSSYTNYKLKFKLTNTSQNDIVFRLRSGTTDNSTTNYNYQGFTAISTTLTGFKSTGATYGYFGYAEVGSHFFETDIFSPQETEYTGTQCNEIRRGEGTNMSILLATSNFGATTSFDGITIYPLSGTITGTARVYGYKN